ncbi:plasmid stabilization system protein ParE [Wenyingzhuangia heitensis]|uniref:Plasmid stabilization system protein ParE n=1 Tax=Wenyingzhuangia heitensis TaxID=1487859 RepID=A0ABX0UD20_9FLAO|nr:type II toxin-antitoxin system RelE/ParE family toxin [Wenyingzhuangia heitensis]NIJ46628.1 plasmid stabilization system protein ParE [Wenyingzhuangia heitensis]
MASVELFWTQTAMKQRNEIFKYWNKKNKSTEYSKKLRQSIKERTQILKTNPEIGKETNYKLIRMVSLGHYSILYQFLNNEIIITSFWDNRQSPKKLLKLISK